LFGQLRRHSCARPLPERARVRSYPLVERYGWAWIWLGEPALADPESIPDFHWLGDPAYAATGTTNHVRANYELVTDNLLDLSHVGFVHGTTIGNNEMGNKGKITSERTEKGVRVTRWVIDCAPPPTYCKTGAMTPDDRIDRWQVIDFAAPCFVTIYAGGAQTGTGAPEGNRVGGLGTWVMNAMTPETMSSTHYYWAIGRDFRADNPGLTEILHRELAAAFDQDKHILELQQAAIDRFSNPPSIDILADAGGIQARRIVRQRIKAERENVPGGE
jgi:phenylpropionate dioxygenase-like ring-hydroxylating dioxygenase large terminal subunit